MSRPSIGPRYLSHLLRIVFDVARRLRRQREGRSFASLVAVQTNRLLIPPEVHFVPPRGLQSKSQARVLPCAVIQSLMRKIWVIQKFRYVAGILVSPQRHILAIALVTGCPVKPEPVFLNRTSERSVDVPYCLQLAGSAQTRGPQRLSEIASLQSG